MIFIIIALVLLILILFLILKKAAKTVDEQVETYFVDKLQAYDYLIQEKEEKISKLNDEIKEKENEIPKTSHDLKESVEVVDSNDLTELAIVSDYQSSGVLNMKHLIDDNFDIDAVEIINKFLKKEGNTERFELLRNIKNIFDLDVVFSIQCLDEDNQEQFMKELLGDSFKVYLEFKEENKDTSIDNFINYLDYNIKLNSPYICVLVGDKKENYDYLSKRIKTVYDKRIYKGIKIKYQNRVYDYSISEGRGIV